MDNNNVRDALDRMCSPLHESRLSGVTAQEDARCMALIRDEIERLTTCLIQMQEAAKDLTRQLTESQAREQALMPVGVVDKSGPGPLEVRLNEAVEYGCALPHGTKLYLATDHTALDALLKAELAKERERCAKVCDAKYAPRMTGGFPREASTARSLAKEIRALGGE